MSSPGNAPEPVMPCNNDAEKAVLGAMILDANAIDTATSLITAEVFYNARHQQVFGAIMDLHEQSVTVDYTTLIDELRRRGQLEGIGGQGYILGLEQYVFSTRHVDHHIRILIDKYQLRRLARTAQEIQERALTEQSSAAELLEEADSRLSLLNMEASTRDFVSVHDLTLETMDHIERLSQGDSDAGGVATGFQDLDRLTGGLQKSDLLILAARPSLGKTALALNLALNIGAGRRGKSFRPELSKAVGIFSLEISSLQVNQRLLSSISDVPMQIMRTGKMSQSEHKALFEAGRHLETAPIYVDDTPNISAVELRAKARRLAAKLDHKLGLIIVDYLQLMRGGGGRNENRQQEISEISRSIKALARELNVPILALSQLSRLIEQRKGKNARRPMLSDLRESGAIEQDADVVMFIHRDKTAESNPSDPDYEPPPVEDCLLIIGKQRNGPLDDVPLIFFRKSATFMPRLDLRHEPLPDY